MGTVKLGPPLTCLLLGTTAPLHAAASHCEGCTTPRPSQMSIAPAEVGPDDPLVITMEQALPGQGYLIDPSHWDTVEVLVEDGEGAVVEGELLQLEGYTPALWRPTTPFIPGTYAVTARAVPNDDCPAVEETVEVVVLATAPPSDPPSLEVSSTARTREFDALDNYVCCDGARPYHPDVPGTGCFPTPQAPEWLEGHCSPIARNHTLTLDASIDAASTGRYTLRESTTGARPNQGSTRILIEVDEPDCLTFELLDLRTAEVSTSQWCPDDVPLGVLEREGLDAELEAACESTLYQCAHDGCREWPSGAPYDPDAVEFSSSSGGDDGPETSRTDGDSDAGCRVSHRKPGAPLLLTVLWLRRRRRRG